MKSIRWSLQHLQYTAVWVLLCLMGCLAVRPAFAQTDAPIQKISGRIEAGEIVLYLLPDLTAGQTIHIRAQTVSGNLDPLVGIIDGKVDPNQLEADYEQALDQAISEGADPLEIVDTLRDRYLLAWDDDGGGGLTAALSFEIPEDGDYRLLITGALSVFGSQTAGEYELLLGLDAPQVLDGEVEPTGDALAVLDTESTPPGVGAESLTITLFAELNSEFVQLIDFKQDDVLYARLENPAGGPAPGLMLRNFAGKPVRSSNLGCQESTAQLEYTFPDQAQNFRLDIVGENCQSVSPKAVEYRLLLGVNDPQVLNGSAELGGRRVAKDPVVVEVGLSVEQIIDVDQQSEFFTTVSLIEMEWFDPALAFNPESCNCDFKAYSEDNFDQFIADSGGRWPAFSFHNQQGNRWTQNRVVVVNSDGKASYRERFTTNFQVDFDFRRYPFDTQTFSVRVDSLWPEEIFQFSDQNDLGSISSEHGEDEFILENLQTDVSSQSNSDGRYSSYTLSFEGPRHLNYYIYQVFLPILLIIAVSYITFFLRDYKTRIEVATGNLLLFIAFSFSLSENYPRLGYTTFFDMLMALIFAINALVVLYNVWLRRIEMQGQAERADRIDSYLDWIYPISYLAVVGIVVLMFF